MKRWIPRDRKRWFVTNLLIMGTMCIASHLPAQVCAQSRIDVSSDKEKTVYSIGSAKPADQEDSEDKKKAWEMLKNMGVIVDRRRGQIPQSGTAQGQASGPSIPATTHQP